MFQWLREFREFRRAKRSMESAMVDLREHAAALRDLSGRPGFVILKQAMVTQALNHCLKRSGEERARAANAAAAAWSEALALLARCEMMDVRDEKETKGGVRHAGR